MKLFWRGVLALACISTISLPGLAQAAKTGGKSTCTDTPVRLIVAPQNIGSGGISGDGALPYTGTDTNFAGGTVYEDGIGGVYVKFQICNGTNDMVINLRNSASPARYLMFDFSAQLAPAAAGAISVAGHVYGEQGQNVNELANASLYTNGQFTTCVGSDLTDSNWTSRVAGHAIFNPQNPTAQPTCNTGTGPTAANQPASTSPGLVTQLDACTWTVSPVLDSTGLYYRIGVWESSSRSVFGGGQFNMPFKYRVESLATGCYAP